VGALRRTLRSSRIREYFHLCLPEIETGMQIASSEPTFGVRERIVGGQILRRLPGLLRQSR